MKPMKKVLVAIDFSSYSEQTLAHAVLMAAAFSAELTIVNVINGRDLEMIRRIAAHELSPAYVDYQGNAEKDYIQQVTLERTRALGAMLKAVQAEKLSVKTIFRTGVPFKEILAVVEDEQAELLVIGAKGRSNVMDVLFGSTAENIQRLAKISVLSVRTQIPS